MKKIMIIAIFMIIILVGVFLVVSHPTEDIDNSPEALTDTEISELFPSTYYPGEVSSPPMIKLVARHADFIALARITEFKYGGFDRPEISWEVFMTTVKILKGQGENSYVLPIKGPERNFGKSAQGRLFVLFIRTMDDKMLWNLEPWFPEIEDLVSSK